MNPKDIQKQTKKLRLLYVEDEEGIREETYKFLDNFFKKTDPAKNGREALDLFIKNGYDVVISDLKMPRMSGEELLKNIKEANPDTITIAMSGISGGDKNFKLESDYYLKKPATASMFLEILEQIAITAKEKI